MVNINKFYVFFVFLIFGFLLVASIPLSYGYQEKSWEMYGNDYLPLHDNQYAGSSRFQDGYTTISTNIYGMSSGTGHPLIGDFYPNESRKNYLIFQDDNYLVILDKDLNLVQEIYIDSQSIGAIGLDNDVDTKDYHDDIEGLWEINNTAFQYRLYKFDPETETFNSSIYRKNFTVNNVTTSKDYYVTGIRNRHFVYGQRLSNNSWDNKMVEMINLSSHNSIDIPDTPNKLTEPLAYLEFNGDNLLDYMSFNSNRVLIWDENGDKISEITPAGENIREAKVFNPDPSSEWRIVTTEESIDDKHRLVYVYKLDGSILWHGKVLNQYCNVGSDSGIAIADYDKDGYDDVFAGAGRMSHGGYMSCTVESGEEFRVFRGSDGEVFASSGFFDNNGANHITEVTTADLTGDDRQEIIMTADYGNSVIYDFSNQELLYSGGSESVYIPADLDFDGLLDIIDASSNSIRVFYPNYTNNNAQINQITYDPATTVKINTTITAIIEASDIEGNIIKYRHKCSNSDNWSSTDGDNSRECYYNEINTYNLTVAVRDIFHETYNSYSKKIYVTSKGSICGDGICDSGESYETCPEDCEKPEESIGGENQTVKMPTKLVDTEVENMDEGLLPEIYYGLLAFFSFTLRPLIILIFAIFFVLIMLAIARIIKKVGQRAGSGGTR